MSSSMSTIQHQRFPAGMAPLEQLPQEVLEVIAQFCGDVASVSPSEQADIFTEVIVHPYLDSPASNTWQPAYQDLRSMAIASRTFTHPAQRALFKIAMVKTTGHLMRLLRSLLLYPENRRYVRCLVARIEDHARPLPIRFIKPQPLVLSEFLYFIHPLLSTTSVQKVPDGTFFRRTVPLLQDTFHSLEGNNFSFSLSVIDSTEVNLHTIEDQVMTATIQLCPKLTAARISFGTPERHAERPEAASQPVRNPPIYATLLEDRRSNLKSLTLDFGALLSLTNLKRYVPGYPVGCPSSIERLTLVGNETDSKRPYHLFDLNIFSKWLSTNKKLRELRMLHGFDKLVTYKRFNNTQPQRENWNSILRAYRDTLEVLVLDCYHPSSTAVPQARFGHSGMLDCLLDMQKLHYLKVPLHSLSGREFGLPPGAEDWEITWVMRAGLPLQWRKMDIMVMNPDQWVSAGERMPLTWRVVEFRSSPTYHSGKIRTVSSAEEAVWPR